METRKKILLSITGIITVFLITIGASYAYFTANLTGGEDSTTITVIGGTMNIIYNGGASINIFNIIPSNNPATTKTFTVTGNNTTDVEMFYKISLIIETNTFSEEALKYKLISTNIDNNGTVIPNINELTNIGTGAKTIELGVGEFTSPTNGNKIHTYNLEIYFPNTETNQNIDQEKEIRGYIKIENEVIVPVLLSEAILSQDGGISIIESKENPTFSKIAVSQNTYDLLPETGESGAAIKSKAIVENGLYVAEDEYGMSYYYRGENNLLNNNLIFGRFQWKIIRINGDGSIRLIYNGTEEEFNTNGTINTTEIATSIERSYWNETNRNDAKYVGYMYGGINGVISTSRESAVLNETSNNAKIKLDNWYQINIVGKTFENRIVDNLFCNDREVTQGPGYGTPAEVETSYYAPRNRLNYNDKPTLKCTNQNDRFTVNDEIIGNGALTYPIGLITIDEASMAGLTHNTNNISSYLWNNQNYWTMSPGTNNFTNVYSIRPEGTFGGWSVDSLVYLRPVINIKGDVVVSGDGTDTNPFIVKI